MPPEEFREAMASAEEVGADILATAEQIADRFFLFGGNVNRSQGAGPDEHGQVPRIASIGCDPIARPARNQRRRDDLARHLVRRQKPLQLEAARPRFVAALHRPAPTHAIDKRPIVT
jgi:hypothetical protein